MKKYVKNSIAISLGVFVALILVEIILRVFHPFNFRIRGNEITLPANIKYEYSLPGILGLDSHIIHTKNGLGFRGPELPKQDSVFRIFCVGGSTTECFYLSDGKDWPNVLGMKLRTLKHKYWVNNAGLDGHSTRGHILLLRDQLLKYKPKIVIFLVGCNDVAASTINKYEKYHLANKKRFLENFEIFSVYHNWRMSKAASKAGMGHNPINWRSQNATDTSQWEQEKLAIQTEDTAKLAALISYRKRLEILKNICNKNNIQCVFVTQPVIFDDVKDPSTGVYLGALEFLGKSGLHYKAVLDNYNQTLIKANYGFTIDAAKYFPSDTKYYYDFFHYTNDGAEKMAEIIFQKLVQAEVVQ